MKSSRLDYELPPELVAQHPAPERAESRLMVLHAHGQPPFASGRFADTFLAQLRPDDLVVVNDSRVLHARLRVQRPGGGQGELLLVAPHAAADGVPRPDAHAAARWRALARPARKLRAGMELVLVGSSGVCVEAVERLDSGEWLVELPVPEVQVPSWLEEHGELPLPPYICLHDQQPGRYQTVYAGAPGSVAAPTAGLHFDERMWQGLRASHEVAPVTLHVGPGTFLPVREDNLSAHEMHPECYEVPPATDTAVRTALDDGRRVVAIGTTTTRVLETAYGPAGAPLLGSTRLFISPGYRYSCVGAMLTNFHLPRSTLLALVMAFAGEQTMRAAYRQAIEDQMRFYSFGDAMFIHGAQQ